MAVNVGDIDGDRFEDRCALWWITASAGALLVTMEWLVGRATALGNVAQDAAVTHQLVRGSRGGSVSKSFPATLAFIRALVVGAPAGGKCAPPIR
jgi:hypothetical protein